MVDFHDDELLGGGHMIDASTMKFLAVVALAALVVVFLALTLRCLRLAGEVEAVAGPLGWTVGLLLLAVGAGLLVVRLARGDGYIGAIEVVCGGLVAFLAVSWLQLTRPSY